MKYCFGVDIGGTTVKLGLFTTEGEIVDKWEIKTRTENQGEAVLPDIAAALNEKLEEKQIPKEPKYKKQLRDFFGMVYFTKCDCPCCGKTEIYSNANYCPECGQKIDWGDE